MISVVGVGSLSLSGCSDQNDAMIPLQSQISGLSENLQSSIAKHYKETQSPNMHSFANTDEIKVKHFNWNMTVDFASKILDGFVLLDLDYVKKNVDRLVLDTSQLKIKQVEAVDANGKWATVNFTLKKAHPIYGQALEISLPQHNKQVKISYSTSPDAVGLQWLDPEQTSGKKQPFLFTKASSIHARSFIPIQDVPAVRMTYDAIITTPDTLRAVMSANNDPKAPKNGVYSFNMPQTIPSYLIALAVGDLQFKATGDRTGVYAEPNVLQAAANEFSDTEKMLDVTEEKFGPYSWGRYDVLLLPPSFPIGGMENPRLSFITPTVIAGDKSLVSMIAHELAHSWSGNTVTNASWNNLWLNEGFTTYLTYRIMEILYGEERYNMEMVLGYQNLQQAIKSNNKAMQLLMPDMVGKNPDDVFNDIPYEKGALFVKELEKRVGRETFDEFLKNYFEKFAFQSISTERFLAYLQNTLIKQYPDKINMARVKQWIDQPGIPENAPRPTSKAFTKIDQTRSDWLGGKMRTNDLQTDGWTYYQWAYFLNNLPQKVSIEKLRKLDKKFNLTHSMNSEIAHSWFLVAISNNYVEAADSLENYLIHIGRKKLIVPLYQALMKTDNGRVFAKRVYKEARSGYHPLARVVIDPMIELAS